MTNFLDGDQELQHLKNILLHVRARLELSYNVIAEKDEDWYLISTINLKSAIELMEDYGKTEARIELEAFQ